MTEHVERPATGKAARVASKVALPCLHLKVLLPAVTADAAVRVNVSQKLISGILQRTSLTRTTLTQTADKSLRPLSTEKPCVETDLAVDAEQILECLERHLTW